jgi:hypothetical protein
MDDRELYRSDDAGSSWRFMGTVSDYWESLAASILDPELFAWGGVELHVSRDGGESFRTQSGWSEYYGDPANRLHADIPGIDVLPDQDSEVWYISTDGGLYRSLDQLGSVQSLSLSGLRVSQYYGTLTSSADPDHIAAGSQDQGYPLTELDYGPDAGDKYRTVYFRVWVSVSSEVEVLDLTLSLRRDDGAVVYLDGLEFLRDNMPGDQIGFDTLASSTVSGGSEGTYWDTVLEPAPWTPGEHLIAVEVDQATSDSSDLGFDLVLGGTVLVTPSGD